MKKILALTLVLFLLVVILCGCDPNHGKRPYDYGPARWIDEDHDIWFDVDENKQSIGEVTINGKTIQIILHFASGSQVAIAPYEDDTYNLLSGKGDFSETEMSISDFRTDELFGGKVEELVFVRQELSESSSNSAA